MELILFLSELKRFQVTVTVRCVAPLIISVSQTVKWIQVILMSSDVNDHDHSADLLQWQILQFKQYKL